MVTEPTKPNSSSPTGGKDAASCSFTDHRAKDGEPAGLTVRMTRPGVWWNERSERAGVSGSRPSAVRAPPPTLRPGGLRPRRLLFPPKPLYDDTSHGAPG